MRERESVAIKRAGVCLSVDQAAHIADEDIGGGAVFGSGAGLETGEGLTPHPALSLLHHGACSESLSSLCLQPPELNSA